MKALAHLNKYFFKYRWRLSLGIVFIILTNVFTVYTPQLIREAVDFLKVAAEKGNSLTGSEVAEVDLPFSLLWLSKITGENETFYSLTSDSFFATVVKVALLLGLLYIVIYAVKGVFSFMTRQTIIIMSRLIEFDLKNEVYNHYQRLDVSFYKRNNTGDLMNRISEDVSKVRMYVGPAVMYTLNLFILIIIVVSVMMYIDWELTLWALAPLPLMSFGIYYVSSMINRRSERAQRQQSKLSSIVQETISGVRVLKAYTREDSQKEFFKKESDAYKSRILDQVKVDALFMPIIVLLVGLSTVLTIYIGGLKVINEGMELGTIFSFVFYVNMLTWPFASVGWVTSLVQKAEASQKRINEFLETEPEIKNHNPEPSQVQGDLEFKGVSFTYPDSGLTAIKDLSFTIKKGQTLAITGRTGSGKSTLANLILRMYDSDSGLVLIDGVPIADHNLFDLRTQIGYVPQDVFLFSDTIQNNIAFGVDGADEATIVKAAQDADIHSNILKFEHGYQTLLGERGINLSGGQKQRMSIARAIIKNPQILIFDDCLSAVDTETEEKILNSLKTLMKDKTSVIISHRVSSIRHADHILVLDEGKLIEQGTHDSLLKQEGVYAELHQKQLLEERAA